MAYRARVPVFAAVALLLYANVATLLVFVPDFSSTDDTPHMVLSKSEVVDFVLDDDPFDCGVRRNTFWVNDKDAGENMFVAEQLRARGWKQVFELSDDVYLRWSRIVAAPKKALKAHRKALGLKAPNEKCRDQHVENFGMPHVSMLSRKRELHRTLRMHWMRIGRPESELDTFLPETYRLFDFTDRARFFLSLPCTNDDNSLWIFKYSTSSGARDIFLMNNYTETRDNFTQFESELIVQRYVMNPLLIDGRKFHVRTFVLIANGSSSRRARR